MASNGGSQYKGQYDEVQIGRGISDVFRASDQFVRVEISATIATDQLYLFFDTGIAYHPDTRYYARITTVGTGEIETHDLPRTAFKRMFSSADDTGGGATGSIQGITSGSDGVRAITLLDGAKDGVYKVKPSGDQYVVFDPKGNNIGALTQTTTGPWDSPVDTWVFSGPQITFEVVGNPLAVVSVTGTSYAPSGLGGALPADSPIKACGFSYFGREPMVFRIKRVRPYPLVHLPYAPYITPYTVNLMNGQLIEWRGSPGSGYTFPHGWAMIGHNDGLDMQVQFLKDAQDAWQAEFGVRGPFHASYVWDRSDTQILGEPNTWSFEWHDPNTEWCGYKYRPFESACRAAYMKSHTMARQVALDFAVWLDGHWADGGPPTNYKSTGAITTEYPEPHAAAYCLRAAIWLYLDGQTAVALSLATKAYSFLQARYIATPDTIMEGSWANNQVVDADPNDHTKWQWWGFWHMEIVDTLGTLLAEGADMIPLIGATVAEIRVWIRGSNRFLARWTRSVTPMNEEELGCYMDGEEPQPAYTVTNTQELDLPMEVEVQFSNPDLAYGDDVRYSRLFGVKTTGKRTYKLPIVLTGPEAEALASKLLYIAWSRRDHYSLRLPIKYAGFDPGDVIPPILDGAETAIFVAKATYNGPFIDVQGYKHDPEVYRETAFVGARDAPRLPELVTPGDTALYVMNLPILSGQNVGLPITYIAASGGKNWMSGVAYRSTDGENWDVGGIFKTYTTMGIAFGAPGDGAAWTFDERSTLSVVLLHGTLESVDDAALLAGANAAVVGDEIIQFGHAEQQEDGSWTLSHLLRGRRGTEWAIPRHENGERFVLLSSAVVGRANAVTSIGQPVFWKAVTTGQHPNDGVWQPFTNDGRSLKPFSPVHITGERDGNGDLHLTWIRRTRVPGEWTDGDIDVPLGEAREEYEIDILDTANEVIVRTIQGLTSSTYTYTAAQQIVDFGAIQYWVELKVYQISAVVGRGYPGTPYEGGV